jgi:hypothetical protein
MPGSLRRDHARSAGEPQPKTAFRRHSAAPVDTGEHFLPESSREQSAVLSPFACHPSRCGRDDAPGARHAARTGAPGHAPVRARAERAGKNRSVAGRTNAEAARLRQRVRPSRPRRRLPTLKGNRSIAGAWRALPYGNRDHFLARLEPRCGRRRRNGYPQNRLSFREKLFAPWNKWPLLPRRHSCEPSRLRHGREATKLTPRCLN